MQPLYVELITREKTDSNTSIAATQLPQNELLVLLSSSRYRLSYSRTNQLQGGRKHLASIKLTNYIRNTALGKHQMIQMKAIILHRAHSINIQSMKHTQYTIQSQTYSLKTQAITPGMHYETIKVNGEKSLTSSYCQTLILIWDCNWCSLSSCRYWR